MRWPHARIELGRQGAVRPPAGVGDRASVGPLRRAVLRRIVSRTCRSRPMAGSILRRLERRLAALAAAGPRPLVSLMLANNETGVIQPVAAGGRAGAPGGRPPARRRGPGSGKISCQYQRSRRRSYDALGAQAGWPQGGRRADQARRGPASAAAADRGGGQERGARAGTENVAGIAGFGAAAEAARSAADGGGCPCRRPARPPGGRRAGASRLRR